MLRHAVELVLERFHAILDVVHGAAVIARRVFRVGVIPRCGRIGCGFRRIKVARLCRGRLPLGLVGRARGWFCLRCRYSWLCLVS
jgi:hypothetical protein